MNSPESITSPTLAFIGGGSTGQTTREYLNAVNAGMVEGVEQAQAYALVAMADSGSRSGDLRERYGIAPPGDVRRSISALSTNSYAAPIFERRFSADSTVEDVDQSMEDLMTALSYSDTTVSGARKDEIWTSVVNMAAEIEENDPKRLKGLTAGHLVVAALMVEHESAQKAAQEAGLLMDTMAEVIPVTDVPHHLIMLDGDEFIVGEGAIDDHTIQNPEDVQVALAPVNPEDQVVLHPRALQAIKMADKIIVGPGSVYTSMVPALLPEGMSEALNEAKAEGKGLAIVANLVTEPTETEGWTASDYVRTTEAYAGTQFTEVVINDNTAGLPEDRAVKFSREDFDQRDDLVVHATDLVKKEDIEEDPNDPLAAHRAKAKHDMTRAAHLITPATVRQAALISA